MSRVCGRASKAHPNPSTYNIHTRMMYNTTKYLVHPEPKAGAKPFYLSLISKNPSYDEYIYILLMYLSIVESSVFIQAIYLYTTYEKVMVESPNTRDLI